MVSSRFDPKLFFRRAENVALHVPADEVFGLLRRSLDLPASWGAMVARESGATDVVRAGGVVDGTNADTVLFVRCTPIEVSFSEDRLASSDSLLCRVDVTLRLTVIPDRGELVSFVRAVLGSHRVAQSPGIARFLQPALRAAVSEFARERTADAMLDPASADEVSAVIAAAMQAPCFAAGLTLEGKPVVRFDSESVRALQQTKEKAVRVRAEHEVARDVRRAIEQAQDAHLAHVADLLHRLDGLSAASPNATLGELVRTFPDTQRGDLYGALFAVDQAAARTCWIVIAAGDALHYFDPCNLDRPSRTVQVDGEAGRVRSVQVCVEVGGAPALWLGAERGVCRLPVDGATVDRTFVVPGASGLRGGFNSIAVVDGRVIASHSELGIWQWNIDGNAPGAAMFENLTRNAKTVRHIQTCDGWAYCAIDNRVVRWSPDGSSDAAVVVSGSSSSITALLVAGEDVYAGNTDGDVLRWSADRPGKPERIHMGTQRAVESIFALDTHGVRRLFFTDTSPRVHARVMGDNFTRFYEAGGQTLRRVEVAGDIVVGTNELRDRVFVWSTGAPGPARNVIPVGSLTGRSVQDVCLVAQT